MNAQSQNALEQVSQHTDTIRKMLVAEYAELPNGSECHSVYQKLGLKYSTGTARASEAKEAGELLETGVVAPAGGVGEDAMVLKHRSFYTKEEADILHVAYLLKCKSDTLQRAKNAVAKVTYYQSIIDQVKAGNHK